MAERTQQSQSAFKPNGWDTNFYDIPAPTAKEQRRKEEVRQDPANFLNSFTQAMFEALENNKNICHVFTQQVIAKINELKLDFEQAFLKVISPYDFEILIFVSEEAILSDSLNEVYEYVTSLEFQNTHPSTLQFLYMFSGSKNDIDYGALAADGYIFRYAPPSKENPKES